jgi:hypothetical protein
VRKSEGERERTIVYKGGRIKCSPRKEEGKIIKKLSIMGKFPPSTMPALNGKTSRASDIKATE